MSSPINVPRGRGTHHLGLFVYAFCNIRTNQVIYSLTKELKPRHFRRLADAGANNHPDSGRKDLWMPFYTVIHPNTKEGRSQGLHMYKQLHEWLTLHQTSWKPSALLSRPYNQDEIDKMQEKYDQRGGSKKESVYDIIRREKKKMRARAVMDQKANSVADLAAVLLARETRNAGGQREIEEVEADAEPEATGRDSSFAQDPSALDAAASSQETSQHKSGVSTAEYNPLLPSSPPAPSLDATSKRPKPKHDRKRGRAGIEGHIVHTAMPQKANDSNKNVVSVMWRNVFDLEFAEKWPDNVDHKPMQSLIDLAELETELETELKPEEEAAVDGTEPSGQTQGREQELQQGQDQEQRMPTPEESRLERDELVQRIEERVVGDVLGWRSEESRKMPQWGRGLKLPQLRGKRARKVAIERAAVREQQERRAEKMRQYI